jgi:hypothetical protein
VLGDFGEKGVLNIGQIHVGKVDPVNTTLKFEPGPKPSRLEGTVTEAFAKKIHVKLKGEEKK